MPDPEQPEVGVPGIPDKQPLPEEILAAGLIPPDQGIVSAEATEESAAAADATSTLEEDVQTDTSQQAGASQVAGAEEPALTDTLASAELSPSSTAALIQVIRTAWTFLHVRDVDYGCTKAVIQTCCSFVHLCGERQVSVRVSPCQNMLC